MLESPSFWYFISFVLFVFIIGVPVFKMIFSHLDDRAKAIAKQLDSAKQSRQEAELFLAKAKEQSSLASKQVEDMLERAKLETVRIEEETVADLDSFLEREKKRAENSIIRLEAESSKRIQIKATEISLKITKNVLSSLFSSGDIQESFNKKTLDELKKINNM
jgi:F-type H+-transporting ATPase subunit b